MIDGPCMWSHVREELVRVSDHGELGIVSGKTSLGDVSR